MSFWVRADKMPPILVRLLARHRHGPPLTDAEISGRSGLSPIQVHVISQGLDWSGVDVPTMRRFLVGCELDFEDSSQMERVDAYLRVKPAPTWKYLRVSPYWEGFYKPLIMRYKQSLTKPNR